MFDQEKTISGATQDRYAYGCVQEVQSSDDSYPDSQGLEISALGIFAAFQKDGLRWLVHTREKFSHPDQTLMLAVVSAFQYMPIDPDRSPFPPKIIRQLTQAEQLAALKYVLEEFEAHTSLAGNRLLATSVSGPFYFQAETDNQGNRMLFQDYQLIKASIPIYELSAKGEERLKTLRKSAAVGV